MLAGLCLVINLSLSVQAPTGPVELSLAPLQTLAPLADLYGSCSHGVGGESLDKKFACRTIVGRFLPYIGVEAVVIVLRHRHVTNLWNLHPNKCVIPFSLHE